MGRQPAGRNAVNLAFQTTIESRILLYYGHSRVFIIY